ncbi:MAG: M18 family aminopeptidase [Pseudomonadota bacterium]|nr:M18 family aminopeptidase [Pseudomonadota bacterium]
MAPALLDRFRSFLDASPTSFHAARVAADLLEARGYTALDERSAPSALPAGARRYVLRGGSIVAFRVGGQNPAEGGFRLAAAHTDSPNLRIKPRPHLRDHGYVRLGVEPYGGVIHATWMDRDLGIAGRVIVRDGAGQRATLVDLRRPLCRIPTLAIHLNRQVNEEGMKLNAQKDLPALFALSDDKTAEPLRDLLAEAAGVSPDALLAWDLGLYDLTPAVVSGVNGEFLHSARLDNLASCHAGLEALLASDDANLPASTAVLALFDHEEIGSTSERGAQSAWFEHVLERIVRDGAGSNAGGLSRALTQSWLISADMAHAVHPAHGDKHDGEHMPKLNAGPVVKQHTAQRYGTEADGAAFFFRLCEQAEVPAQWFVNRSDLACGSTVGPLVAARLGVRAIDVGNPMLSMHSAREMCGTGDHARMVAALRGYMAGLA